MSLDTFALAGAGQARVEHVQQQFEDEMRVVLALTGATNLSEIGFNCLAKTRAT